MPWHYQPSYEHSNPLEQTFPTFTTSFDRLLEELQNLNKSMEARLVKMDERMINWGESISVMDNMPKGTETPRQEVSEQCEENSSMPRKHARAGVTSYMWAGVATSSNTTTTSQDATKSDASANSTESDAENDTITLMLKHETTRPGSTDRICPGSTEATCPSSTDRICPGSPELACPGSKEAACHGSTEVARPGSTEAARPGSPEVACPGSTEATRPGSTELTYHGSPEPVCSGSTKNFTLTAQKASALATN
ncbi:hypothetical protein V6N13_127326 [Hibiscus sabdariffa]